MIKSGDRLWELDFLRGLAIVFMVILHLFADLYFFYGLKINFPLWYGGQRLTAGLFLLLAGISLTLSHARAVHNGRTAEDILKRQILRGLKIFGWGMLITLISRFFLKEWYIRFGILHLIGAATVLSFPFLKYRLWNIGAGLTLIAAGVLLHSLRFPFSWLIWAGFIPTGFRSVDYFPLLPWLGVVLLGIGAGNMLYPGRQRKFALPDWSGPPWMSSLCFLGRHSLVIYLIHQPVILGAMMLVGGVRGR